METYSRAVEPEPSVTITDATFFGHGWQPLTIGVLQAIWFMPQGMSFTVEDLAAWFTKLGWKSVNGRPLGIDGVRRELGLIRKAGYIQATRLRGAGGKVAGIRYEVSKRAHAEIEASGPWIPIESAESETPSSVQVLSPAGLGGQPGKVGKENRRSHHVPSPTGLGGRAKKVGEPFSQVAPCAVGKPNPPHPPEEVETSSPYPHSQPAAPTEEEAERFTPEEIHAAEQFLQLLPAPWAAGRQTARRQAPKLLEAVAEQGWQLDSQLATELTKNPGGIKNYAAVLKTRIADMPLYTAIAAAPHKPRTFADPTYCGLNGCDYGQIERPDGGFAPCPCTRKANAA